MGGRIVSKPVKAIPRIPLQTTRGGNWWANPLLIRRLRVVAAGTCVYGLTGVSREVVQSVDQILRAIEATTPPEFPRNHVTRWIVVDEC